MSRAQPAHRDRSNNPNSFAAAAAANPSTPERSARRAAAAARSGGRDHRTRAAPVSWAPRPRPLPHSPGAGEPLKTDWGILGCWGFQEWRCGRGGWWRWRGRRRRGGSAWRATRRRSRPTASCPSSASGRSTSCCASPPSSASRSSPPRAAAFAPGRTASSCSRLRSCCWRGTPLPRPRRHPPHRRTRMTTTATSRTGISSALTSIEVA